jgi:predicted MFS family arabinose efflux permease
MGEQVATANPAKKYTWYALWLLFCVNLLNYFDRNLITILIEPIRKELSLSDAQSGMLMGLAFAVIYSVLGVPVARIADRGRRVTVLSVSLALWSAMTTLCGFANSFFTLFLARLGVGIGEAGGLPSTHALVAEYFPPEKRGTAMSIVAVGGSVGLLLGLILGGLLHGTFGWRAAFMIAGAPGLIVAVVLALTLREPSARAQASTLASQNTRDALRELWGRKAYVLLTFGLGIATIGAYGHQTWIPTFLIRSFGLTTAQTGVLYGLASAPAALLGVLAGGILSDRLSKKDARWPLWITAMSFAGMVPIALAFFFAPGTQSLTAQPLLVLALAIPIAMLGVIWTAPCFALIQNLAGTRLRATAAAAFMLVTNLVGLSAGPALTGLLSDLLAPRFGADALRYALAIMTLPYLVGVALFLMATRTVKADLARARDPQSAAAQPA